LDGFEAGRRATGRAEKRVFAWGEPGVLILIYMRAIVGHALVRGA
jgi:hypothetical protein